MKTEDCDCVGGEGEQFWVHSLSNRRAADVIFPAMGTEDKEAKFLFPSLTWGPDVWGSPASVWICVTEVEQKRWPGDWKWNEGCEWDWQGDIIREEVAGERQRPWDKIPVCSPLPAFVKYWFTGIQTHTIYSCTQVTNRRIWLVMQSMCLPKPKFGHLALYRISFWGPSRPLQEPLWYSEQAWE